MSKTSRLTCVAVEGNDPESALVDVDVSGEVFVIGVADSKNSAAL